AKQLGFRRGRAGDTAASSLEGDGDVPAPSMVISPSGRNSISAGRGPPDGRTPRGITENAKGWQTDVNWYVREFGVEREPVSWATARLVQLKLPEGGRIRRYGGYVSGRDVRI